MTPISNQKKQRARCFSITLALMVTGLFSSPLSTAANLDWHHFYQIENIDIPKTINPQIGGLSVLKDGRIAVAFHAGEIMLYSPANDSWSQFASGLHEPLGLIEEQPGTLVVMQSAELTRLIDENNNGHADFYQNLSDEFGMSGNYHEFAFGPVRDKQGNYYIALNVASNYAGIFQHLRGEFNPIGLSREAMTNWRTEEWKNHIRHQAGRMFAKVPYRGWVLKIKPDGTTEPFASGFRSPDGLAIDSNNRLWITDNQGDWLGTSPLLHVQRGKFYGHPASLLWQQGWQRDPVTMSAEELDALREPASALFPHGELANSPTQPINTISAKKFGLPKGELLIGDMNQARLIRYLPDQVNGFMQGALIPFLESEQLGIGNHRFDFDRNGDLWIGKTHLGWAGDEGIRRVRWTQKPLFIVDKVELIKNGFKLHFSDAVDKNTVSANNIRIESHHYHYHKQYGSEKVDLQTLTANAVKLNWRKRSVEIHLPNLVEKRLYTLYLDGIKSKTGHTLMGDIVRYTLVQKVKGSANN